MWQKRLWLSQVKNDHFHFHLINFPNYRKRTQEKWRETEENPTKFPANILCIIAGQWQIRQKRASILVGWVLWAISTDLLDIFMSDDGGFFYYCGTSKACCEWAFFSRLLINAHPLSILFITLSSSIAFNWNAHAWWCQQHWVPLSHHFIFPSFFNTLFISH